MPANRDEVDLDITWLRAESLEGMDNLPAPEIVARDIVEYLTAAFAEFEAGCCHQPRTTMLNEGH